MTLILLQRFVAWTKLKFKLCTSQSEKKVFFREREIWWCSLGANIGFEQDGKHALFERPALILRKFNKDMLWILPLTSKDKVGSKFHYKTEYNGQTSFVILSQVRTVSCKRLLRKSRVLSVREFEEVRGLVKGLL